MAIFPSSAIPTAAATSFSIDNSLRFNSADSAYLSWTPGSGGNRKTWTYSFWYKRCKFGSRARIIGTTDPWEDLIRFENNDKLLILSGESSGYTSLTTTQVFRDPSAWYHIVFAVDTTQATASNRAKLYVNGSQVTAFDTETYASQNLDSEFNDSTVHYMGSSAQYIDGYLAEVHFIDGTALTPTSFGEEDADYKHWKPIEVTGLTYGTNGFHLDFATSGTLGNDANGSNNWTANNLAATDQMLDSPTNNFAVLNSIKDNSGNSQVLSEGNLKHLTPGLNTGVPVPSTIGMSSGKWYAEAYIIQGSAGDGQDIGIMEDIKPSAGNLKDQAGSTISYMCFTSNGRIYNDGTLNQSSLAVGSDGNILGIAVDMTAKTVQFYLNNSSLGTAETFSGDEAFFAGVSPVTTNGTLWNFGQDSSFAGNKTAQGNADGEGYGDFYYTPPTDFLALCTNNLPEPAVKPQENFNVVTYTGTGTTYNITGVGFQPDLVILKGRSIAGWHGVFDSVRGVNKRIHTDGVDAEQTRTADLNSFDSDGFQTDDSSGNGGYNSNTDTYVAWNWKAGTSASGTTSGSGTLQSYTASYNADAGFSIVKYVGNATANHKIPHHLGVPAEVVIIKEYNVSGESWGTYHVGMDATSPQNYEMKLDQTVARSSDGYWNNTAPTSTVFNLKHWSGLNGSGDTHIAYCFASKEGYSKMGSYIGNASSDGTFVYTGFRPAYVLIKASSTAGESWYILDSERSSYNALKHRLIANISNAEISSTDYCDFNSNGFKIRWSDVGLNGNNVTYVYLAFAEYPFKYTTAR